MNRLFVFCVGVLLGLALTKGCRADTLVLHAATPHFSETNRYGERYNNINPGAGYAWNNGVTAGAYYNSYRNWSAYVGYQHQMTEELGVLVGVVTGYRKAAQKDGPFACAWINERQSDWACEQKWKRGDTKIGLLIAPSYRYRLASNWAVRASLPNFAGVHFTLERDL
jgi:hypothetical protein